MTTHKTCSKCGRSKPLSEYRRNSARKDGLFTWCKTCARELDRKAREANRPKRAEGYRKWAAANKEHRAEYMREYGHKYREGNKERIAENRRKYSAATKDEKAAKDRAYRKNNHDRITKYLREWHRNNPAKSRAIKINRRARERSAEGEFTSADIQAILTRQKGRCVYCHADITPCFSVDHITPLSRGGTNMRHNLQLLCKACNGGKRDKTHEEYVEYLRRRR